MFYIAFVSDKYLVLGLKMKGPFRISKAAISGEYLYKRVLMPQVDWPHCSKQNHLTLENLTWFYSCQLTQTLSLMQALSQKKI